MKITRQTGHFTLGFKAKERALFLRVLSGILDHYRLAPDDLDPKIRGVWYSTRGCATARLTHEETREWIESLHAFKGAHVRALEVWRQQLQPGSTTGGTLQVPDDQVSVFLTVLNDHRLLVAAQNDIGEAEMSLRSTPELARLDPARLQALFEIQFLAAIIEVLLDQLPGQPGRWAEDTDHG